MTGWNVICLTDQFIIQDNEKNIVADSSTIVNNIKITAEPLIFSHSNGLTYAGCVRSIL